MIFRSIKGKDVESKLRKQGVEIKAGSIKSLSEEAPEVYKDIDEVIEVVHNLGISLKVAKLKPISVIKG